MKRIFFLLLFLPFISQAQKIKVNEFDKFIKQRRVESFPLTVKEDPKINMSISFGAVGSSCYVQLSGSGLGTNIVSEDDRVIFLLDNDSTITAKSTGLQSYDISKTPNTYKHDYILSFSDLEQLSKHSVQALRKYHHVKDFDDIYIPKENCEKIKKLSALFLDELRIGGVLQIAQSTQSKNKADTTAAVGANDTKLTNNPANKTVDTKPKTTAIAPGFPGGREVWMNFLNRNLKPPAELSAGEEKTVTVKFLVSADGSVKDIQITQSAGPSFDNEVIRVLKRMPKWKPAMENGIPVEAFVTQPVTFFRADTAKRNQD